ncbi:MAG: hypothetical protein GEV03_25370 [Streptosporangiales bacterium]|nr:hypothetical protein [Streptosporangiales bacterium]
MRVEGHLKSAVAYAQEKKGELVGRWTGPAEEAFNSWEGGLEGALDATGNAAQSMMKVTAGMLDHVTNTYNAALTLIANTAADVIEAAPAVLDMVLPGRDARYISAMKMVAQILAAFVRNVNQFITQAIGVLNGYQKSVIDIGSATNGIRPVPPLSGAAQQPGGWNPSDFS